MSDPRAAFFRAWLAGAGMLCLFAPAVAGAQTPPRAFGADQFLAEDESLGTEIRADTLLLDRRAQILIYEGNVVARRGSSRLECDRLTVNYDEEQSIESGLCEGNVRFEEGQRRGQADVARFHQARDLVTLSGDVEIQDGLNRIHGERLELELDTERLSVWGSGPDLACTRFQSESDGEAPAEQGLRGMERLWGAAEGPVEVCARRVVLENRRGQLHYVGKVRAVQGQSSLSCSDLEIRYGVDGTVETGDCRGGAKIVREGTVATAKTARLDGIRQIVTLTDDVRVFEEGAEAQAARAVVMLEEDRIVMEGTASHPVVTIVESEAMHASAETDEPPDGERIQDPFELDGSGDGEEPGPLRIRAYWLQATRGACTGLYRGDVVTHHRGITMESDELEVTCDEASNALTAIEARDNVHITNVDGTATADRAHYSASTQRLVLTGERVRFERPGQATLTCREMIFDRASNEMWCGGQRPTDRVNVKISTEEGGDVTSGNLLDPGR